MSWISLSSCMGVRMRNGEFGMRNCACSTIMSGGWKAPAPALARASLISSPLCLL
jgi:hypothetical protein